MTNDKRLTKRVRPTTNDKWLTKRVRPRTNDKWLTKRVRPTTKDHGLTKLIHPTVKGSTNCIQNPRGFRSKHTPQVGLAKEHRRRTERENKDEEKEVEVGEKFRAAGNFEGATNDKRLTKRVRPMTNDKWLNKRVRPTTKISFSDITPIGVGFELEPFTSGGTIQ